MPDTRWSARPGIRAVGAGAVMALALGLTATAGANDHARPGNNGTVKIHDSVTHDEDRRNEPKVCEFYLVGFGFDPAQLIDYHIVGHGGPNAGPGADDGVVVAGPDGWWRTEDKTLPEGMYKLTLTTNQPGNQKHKVFKVECPDDGNGEEPPPPPT